MILLLGYGFIGKVVYRTLKDKGLNVKVISRTVPPNHPDFISTDITSIKSFSKAFKDVETVIHCLHTTAPFSSMNDEVFDIQSNLIPFISILDLCKANNVQNYIYISSGGAVYGQPENLLVNETCSTNPLSSYGITKLSCEKYLLINKDAFKGNVIILRPSNLYGHGQDIRKPQGIVGHAINACENNITINIWGDGIGVKDYLHISDFVKALVAAIDYKEKSKNIVFNVSSGELLSVNQIIEKIELKFKKNINKKHNPPLPFDVQNIALDSNLFRQTFHWQPEYKFNLFLQQHESSVG
jgi:UDP-glucose 4-epimerase